MSFRPAARQFFERRGAPSGPTARDYVHDGLIAMWDGIENAGWGVHDPNATTWKDLVGNDDLTVDYGVWTDSSISNGDSFNRIAYRDSFSFSRPLTMELVFHYKERQHSNSIILHVAQWYSGYSMLRGLTVRDGAYFKMKTNVAGYSLQSRTDPISLSCVYDGDDPLSARVDGQSEAFGSIQDNWWAGDAAGVNLGNRAANNRGTKVEFFSIRYYSRALTAAEIAANYAIDKARFNLP